MSEGKAIGWDPESLVARYLEDPRPDLKDLIMVHYSGLVERLARRFAGLDTQEDLVQVGYIGLLNALSKFDPSNGVKFNTYATHLVAGEIKHYLRDRTQTIRQPAWLQELRHRVAKASTSLQAKLQRPPTEAEIANELGLSIQAVTEVFQTQELLRVTSLDASIPGDEESSDLDNLDASAYCPEQLSVEDRVVLENAMQQLRDLERQVLVHFHFDAMNQTEIAAKLGISCNYVSHILRQSLGKLRRILTNEEESDRELRQDEDSAIVDSSTGVYTEAHIRNRVTEEVHRASSTGAVLSLLVIQFEGLEDLQDFYGKGSVQDFIVDSAEFLKKAVRRLDIVGRFGENGFVVILPSTGPTHTIVKHRLRAKFEPWLNARRAPKKCISISFGSATFPDHCRTPQELFELASQVERAPDTDQKQAA